ncbi:MAG: hypothetical protein VYE68_02810 [Acidobacteriota bacterium]|nr:hypothetical protein [Acidobacteriota bacterium]
MHQREYSAAIQPRENGLVMYTMRRANEVRSMKAIDELDQVLDEVNEAEVRLARQVIGNFEGEIDFGEYEDQYQKELRSVIDAKIAGEEFVVKEDDSPAKVVDLMAALRQSLDSVSAGRKTARSSTTRKTAKAKRKQA